MGDTYTFMPQVWVSGLLSAYVFTVQSGYCTKNMGNGSKRSGTSLLSNVRRGELDSAPKPMMVRSLNRDSLCPSCCASCSRVRLWPPMQAENSQVSNPANMDNGFMCLSGVWPARWHKGAVIHYHWSIKGVRQYHYTPCIEIRRAFRPGSPRLPNPVRG